GRSPRAACHRRRSRSTAPRRIRATREGNGTFEGKGAACSRDEPPERYVSIYRVALVRRDLTFTTLFGCPDARHESITRQEALQGPYRGAARLERAGPRRVLRHTLPVAVLSRPSPGRPLVQDGQRLRRP